VIQVGLSIVSVAALLAAERAGMRPAVAVAKLSASSCFVWAAIASGALGSSFGLAMLGGLALCWLGDALLVPSGQGMAFQLGIGAFLLGHVAYAIAFVGLGVDLAALSVATVLLVVGAVRVMGWLGPHVPGDFRLPVRLYVVVISAMVALSVAVVAAGQPIWLAVGAVGFAASDISVARDRFVAPGFVNGAWGLPLYFGSQLVLAFSIGTVAANT
jgi:uncharacterized membrane protein YhhN